MKLHDVTACGRPVDPRWPSNRAMLIVAAGCLLAAAVLAVVGGADVLAAARDGGHAALLVFVTWALGRELAPDDPAAAFVGLPVLAAAWATGARPDLLAPFALIGLVRIVNRTVGLRPTLADLVLISALAAWATWRGDWPVGVAGGVAMLLNFRLAPRDLRAMPFAAGLAAITVVAWRRAPPVWSVPESGLSWTAAAVVVAFALVLMTLPACTSRGDVGDETLDRRRVQGGMAVGVVALAAALGRGDAAILEASALASAIAGVVLATPWHRLRRR